MAKMHVQRRLAAILEEDDMTSDRDMARGGLTPRAPVRSLTEAERNRRSTVCLDRLLDARLGLHQILGIHHRGDLDVRLEGEEPRFDDRRNL